MSESKQITLSIPEVLAITPKASGWRVLPDGQRIWIHATAKIELTAILFGGATVGAYATVGDDATVGAYATVGDGATVGDDGSAKTESEQT